MKTKQIIWNRMRPTALVSNQQQRNLEWELHVGGVCVWGICVCVCVCSDRGDGDMTGLKQLIFRMGVA